MPSKINLSGVERLRKLVREAAGRGAKVKVGVLASSGQHEGGLSMVELAAIHEFGSPAAGIPERSFIRRTMDLKHDEVDSMVRRTAAAYLKGRVELAQALGILGQFLVAQIKNTITSEQVVPRLSESEAGRRTITRTGSHVTLVDHGQLLNSISYEVVEGGGGNPVEVGEGEGSAE